MCCHPLPCAYMVDGHEKVTVTLVGFNGEFVADLQLHAPLPIWVNRPTAKVRPDIGFDEESGLPYIPGMVENGIDPWEITVEKYAAIGDTTYRRVS